MAWLNDMQEDYGKPITSTEKKKRLQVIFYSHQAVHTL